MTTMNNPQLEGLKEATAAAVVNIYDTFGWPIFMTLLAVLFLGVVLLIGYWTEAELDEFPIMVRDTYRFVRRSWLEKTNR